MVVELFLLERPTNHLEVLHGLIRAHVLNQWSGHLDAALPERLGFGLGPLQRLLVVDERPLELVPCLGITVNGLAIAGASHVEADEIVFFPQRRNGRRESFTFCFVLSVPNDGLCVGLARSPVLAVEGTTLLRDCGHIHRSRGSKNLSGKPT